MTQRKTKGSSEADGQQILLQLEPETLPVTRRIPLDMIDPALQPWHVRRVVDIEKVNDIREAVASAGPLEPLRLVQHGAQLGIVSGKIRYHAAVLRHAEGGPDWVMAEIIPPVPAEELLRRAIAEGEVRFAFDLLEFGWALARLWDMPTGQGGKRSSQQDLIDYLGLPKRWTTRVSEALSAARALPEDAAAELAERHGCPVEDIVNQSRSTFRKLFRAPEEFVPVLLEVLGESVAAGQPPDAKLTLALQALHDPATLRSAATALTEGRSVVQVLAEERSLRESARSSAQSAGTMTGPTWRRLLAGVLAGLAWLPSKIAQGLCWARARIESPAPVS
jgi:hypothetical protein